MEETNCRIITICIQTKEAVELPAECMYELHKGSNCGWPYIYYDPIQHKKILCPEYGGDGKKTGGEDAQDPVVRLSCPHGAKWFIILYRQYVS